MKLCIVALIIFELIQKNYGIYKENFRKDTNDLLSKPDIPIVSYQEKLGFSQIDESQFQEAIDQGIQSYLRTKRLEKNYVDGNIFVQNGSISHAQYLESYPNAESKSINRIASKIMRANEYILNYKCLKNQIWYNHCNHLMSKIKLPESDLLEECTKITRNPEYWIFRRLLSANYSDALHRLYNYQTEPRRISNLRVTNNINPGDVLSEDMKNLVLVQWSQFVEHDLSKPVVTTMDDGTAITCCNQNHYKVLPRHHHLDCVPLLEIRDDNYNPNCLNYVRSALGVNYNCNFGAGEIINQASSTLDLSQLYGYTRKQSKKMRTFNNGTLKTSYGESVDKPFLPLATEKEKYCTTDANSISSCFMSGDTRVNSNPFSITLYTIFLRSHNLIAKKLLKQNLNWTDDRLYDEARKLNVQIYRCIVFNEWLPLIIGKNLADKINNEVFHKIASKSEYETTNEFAVAASRFYYSMLPNSLYSNLNNQTSIIFDLKDNFYKSDIFKNANILNTVMDSMFQQKAMKMDPNYADSVIKHFMKTSTTSSISGSDVLAFDIQRNRDHGLKGYVKYLEACENIKINNWDNLEKYIKTEDIQQLRTVYQDIDDIDLIIGGLFEKSMSNATVGPTFSCIIAEQFSSIRQLQHYLEKDDMKYDLKDSGLCSLTGKLLCETTSVTKIPKNIFLIPSETNPWISCEEILSADNIASLISLHYS